MELLLSQLALSFAPVVGLIVTSLVSWASVEAVRYVRMKTKNDAANNAVQHICHTVNTIVADLNQTMVPAIKEAAGDGKISATEGRKLKNLAFNRINKQIPSIIQSSAGLVATSIPTLIKCEIEKAVIDQKKGGGDESRTSINNSGIR